MKRDVCSDSQATSYDSVSHESSEDDLPPIRIAWSPTALTAEEHEFLVMALSELVREAGGVGVRRLADDPKAAAGHPWEGSKQ